MKEVIKNFKRQELFDMYNFRSNPFSMVTTRIDITNIYNYCKKHGNHYATLGYVFTKAMNNVEEFKYAYENGNIVKYDIIQPRFTQKFDDETVGFFTCEFQDTYQNYIIEFNKIQDKFYKVGSIPHSEELGVVWLSCQPWFSFTGLVPPFDKSITIPQLNWGKFEIENDRCYVHLMIMSHHGFVDGFHIGKLIEYISQEIENFNG